MILGMDSHKFLQNSSGCFHLPHGKCLVWWLPITFIHGTYPLLSSTLLWVVHPQLIMLKMLYQPLLSLSMLCTWPYQAMCCILIATKFLQLILPADKRSQAYCWNTPPPFFVKKIVFLFLFGDPLGYDGHFHPPPIAVCNGVSGIMLSMKFFHTKVSAFTDPSLFLAQLARDDSMSLSSIIGLLKGHGP